MTIFLSRFFNEDDGATSIEYAIVAGGIAVAILVAVNTLGNTVLTAHYNVVKNALNP